MDGPRDCSGLSERLWQGKRGQICASLAARHLPPSDIHFQLCEIAQGLQYLHAQKIVHGDLRGVRVHCSQLAHRLTTVIGKYSGYPGLERLPC